MNTLKVRDLVNVGVFTVIYFIVTYATGMLGMFGPWMIPIAGAFALLLNGIVIMLYLSRVPKFGALTITGLLIGIVMSVGHSYWTIIMGILCGVIADRIQSKAGRAKTLEPRRGQLAYAVFSVWGVSPLIPVFYDADSYFSKIAESWSADYAADMRTIFQPWVIIVWAVVIFLIALIGAQLGIRANRKHFERAGVIKTS